MSTDTDLDTYAATLFDAPSLGFSLDLEAMRIDPAWRASMEPAMQRAFTAMEALEAGAVANPDEKRRVGHYWLRDPARSPDAETRAQIESTRDAVLRFAADVHAGTIAPPSGHRFENALVVGIGGSALGPQLVAHALGGARDKMKVFFFDNTDPDGFDRVLWQIGQRGGLSRTLTVVISKSGGTKETRNGMLEAAAAYERAGLTFGPHAVAVTGEGSELDKHAVKQGWRARFPMWDWVGGRTSVLSAVGLLPAALQGVDALAMLDGARAMDALTRVARTGENPAALLALAWHFAGDGKGRRDMVILPYKDRLELFSRYLQQLVMESLGKERDLDGAVVHQGIAVYGNKGSTDQHAYVQQLRDGVPNFFVTFLEVLRDRAHEGMDVEPGVTAGDYLHGFLEGTRRALAESGRPSLTVTVRDADARALGMLIALYERAVGLYATLVNVNAYHQPGVEAGKRAAADVLALQARVIAALREHTGAPMSVSDVARIAKGDVGTVWRMLRHLEASARSVVARTDGDTLRDARWAVRRSS